MKQKKEQETPTSVAWKEENRFPKAVLDLHTFIIPLKLPHSHTERRNK